MPIHFTENPQRNRSISFSASSRVIAGAGLREATQAEAEAGTVSSRYMSPLRVAQALDGGQLSAVLTSLNASGLISLSNTDATDAVTAFTVSKNWTTNGLGTNLLTVFTSYNDTARFTVRHAGGTQASPTQTLSGQSMGNINWRGYQSGGAFTTTGNASVNCIAAENFTSTAQGTKLTFFTTAIGSATPAQALSLFSDGGAVFGTSTTSPGTNCVSISGTTASTSTTTGALTVAGGAGVVGSLYVGGIITASSRLVGNDWALTDGITAPAAVPGFAVLYVDTSDGDLKVKFGDGFVATIAVDS
jgi:hypothetical protein